MLNTKTNKNINNNIGILLTKLYNINPDIAKKCNIPKTIYLSGIKIYVAIVIIIEQMSNILIL